MSHVSSIKSVGLVDLPEIENKQTSVGKEIPSVKNVKDEMEGSLKEKALKKLKEIGKIMAGVLGTGGLVLLAVPLLVFTVLMILPPFLISNSGCETLVKLYGAYGKSYEKLWDWALTS